MKHEKLCYTAIKAFGNNRLFCCSASRDVTPCAPARFLAEQVHGIASHWHEAGATDGTPRNISEY